MYYTISYCATLHYIILDYWITLLETSKTKNNQQNQEQRQSPSVGYNPSCYYPAPEQECLHQPAESLG